MPNWILVPEIDGLVSGIDLSKLLGISLLAVVRLGPRSVDMPTSVSGGVQMYARPVHSHVCSTAVSPQAYCGSATFTPRVRWQPASLILVMLALNGNAPS